MVFFSNFLKNSPEGVTNLELGIAHFHRALAMAVLGLFGT